MHHYGIPMRRYVGSTLRIRRAGHALWQETSSSSAAPLARPPFVFCSRWYALSTAPSMVAFADGACRGNPGHGACGALLVDTTTQTVVASRSRYLSGQETNNTAEYHGLLLALELAEELHVTRLQICMDSELVVKQMRGEYRVKAPHLRVLFQQSRAKCRAFEEVQFGHVPRDQNALADRLANEALDQDAAESAHAKQQQDVS